MKRIVLFLLVCSMTSPALALNKKNSIGINYGGPFYYLNYPEFTIYYSYTREINDDLALSLNFSNYSGLQTLNNFTIYYYTGHYPGGDSIGSTYVNMTYGGIAYNMFNNPVNGLVLGAGTKASFTRLEIFFDFYYLLAVDPIYVYTGPRGNYSGGIKYRF